MTHRVSQSNAGSMKRRRLLLAGGAVALTVILGLGTTHLTSGKRKAAQISEAHATMAVIRAAAYRWHYFYGESTCPSIRQLVDGNYLRRDVGIVDPWDQPYSIGCKESGAVVISNGPDRRQHTADDIVVATPNRAFAGAH